MPIITKDVLANIKAPASSVADSAPSVADSVPSVAGSASTVADSALSVAGSAPIAKYKRVIAIDIGSTNSQIAQCYQVSNDGGTTWTIEWDGQKDPNNCLLKLGGTTFDIPTIIVTEKDVSVEVLDQIPFDNGYKFTDTNGQQIRFFVGKVADDILHSYPGVKGRLEFKKNFFCSNEELSDVDNKEKFYDAKESMKILLSFFKTLNDNVPKRIYETTVEDETIITVPLRATDFERSTMRKLAEEVGFKKIQIRDEASAVLRYALMDSNSELRTRLQELTLHQKLSVLIVDVGGSTTDILLVEIKHDGQCGFKVDELGRWPKIGEKNTLGGIDIDKKICEWFKSKNYLLPGKLEHSLQTRGYQYFREFKEHSSHALSKNGNVIVGGNLEWLINGYPLNGKFNSEVYLKEVADEYLPKMCTAIHAVLEDCLVREDGIDCIVASGGGARMYGVEQLLKGEYIPTIDRRFQFVKVQKNTNMYIKNREFSSALCAIGSAWPLPKITFKNACPCDYLFRIQIYLAHKDNVGDLKENKDFTIKLPDMKSYKELNAIEHTFAKKNEALPTKPEDHPPKKYNLEICVPDDHVFIILLSLWSRTEDSKEHFQKGWSTSSERTLGNAIKQTLKSVINTTVDFINIFNPFSNGGNVIEESSTVNATFTVDTEVTEDYMIKLTPNFYIEGQTNIDKKEKTAN